MHAKSFKDLEVYQIARQLAGEIFELSRHFISKLIPFYGTDGEQQETQHWIETGHDCNYISARQASDWLQRYGLLGKKLNTMMEKSDTFCGGK